MKYETLNIIYDIYGINLNSHEMLLWRCMEGNVNEAKKRRRKKNIKCQFLVVLLYQWVLRMYGYSTDGYLRIFNSPPVDIS